MKKLSIIVPVYNEEKTIDPVLKSLQKLKIPGWKKEIVVVNDGSTDNTFKILKKYKKSKNFEVINHSENKGKGAALVTALKKVSGDVLVVQDADLEYNPEEISKLLKVYEKKGGLVLGSRNLKPKRKGYAHYVFGVWILTTLTNVLFSSKLTDVYTCYKLMSVIDAKSLKLISYGFEIEMEIIAKALNNKIIITEVPISYTPRSFSEGKKINWRDGLKGLETMLRIKYLTKVL